MFECLSHKTNLHFQLFWHRSHSLRYSNKTFKRFRSVQHAIPCLKVEQLALSLSFILSDVTSVRWYSNNSSWKHLREDQIFSDFVSFFLIFFLQMRLKQIKAMRDFSEASRIMEIGWNKSKVNIYRLTFSSETEENKIANGECEWETKCSKFHISTNTIERITDRWCPTATRQTTIMMHINRKINAEECNQCVQRMQ